MAILPIAVKHFKVSDKADGQDPTLLQPSDWNKDHVFKVDAKSLVGNTTNSPGDATSIPLSDEFKFEDGKLSLGSNFEDAEVVVSVNTEDFPGARVLTTTPTVAWDFATAKQAKANVPDKGVTLAKMELGPVGAEILYYDKDSKAPVRLPAGTAGMVLKTGTVAIVGPPAVAATNPSWGFSGAPHALLKEFQASGLNGHNGADFTQNVWHDRFINFELYDLYGFVTLASVATTNTVFTLPIGTWVIEWSCPAYGVVRHQTRLYNNTDSAHPVFYGTSEVCGTIQTRSIGIVQVAVTVATGYKIQHFCTTTNTNGFGLATDAGTNPENYTIVKIWRVA